MNDLRLPAVAARLVAWHNRHPLARRISAAQVHAVGYVALPFVGVAAAPAAGQGAANAVAEALAEAAAGGESAGDAASQAHADTVPEAGSLRERALARARLGPVEAAVPVPAAGAALQADFNEDFIDPLTPRQVARFAARLGRLLVRLPADGPVREVRATGKFPGRTPATVYLLTAAIETDTRRSRVLLGPGMPAEVLGRRIFSVPRVAATLAALLGVALLLFSPLQAPVTGLLAGGAAAGHAASAASGPAPPAAAHGVGASQPASAVRVAAAASALPAVAQPVTTAAHEPLAASAAAAAPQPVAPTVAPTPPLDVPARLGRIDMPSLRPQLSEGEKSAARLSRPGGPPLLLPLPEAAFALSSRTLRTRAEADQVRVAMLSLLRAADAGPVRVDVLPEGDDWRVVGYPFPQRAEADKARALLVSRGLRVEVVGF